MKGSFFTSSAAVLEMLILLAACRAGAAGQDPASFAERLLPGGRWAARPLLAADLGITAPAGPRFPLVGLAGRSRWWALGAGLFHPDLAVEIETTSVGGGRLLVALLSDPDRSRGLAIDLGEGEAPEVVCTQLLPGGWSVLRRARRQRQRPGSAVAWRLTLRDRGLAVSCAGETVIGEELVTASGLAPGRILIGASSGTVEVSSAAVEGRITTESQSRHRWRARLALPALEPPLPLPAADPLDLVGREVLGRGLPPASRDRLWELARRSLDGAKIPEVRDIEGLASAAPGQPGPALAAGVMRLVVLADPEGAIPHLERAGDLAGAAELLGDAHWLRGDLDAADSAYARAAGPHDGRGGQALVLWSRGQRGRSFDLANAAAVPGCRSCAQRLQLARDLGVLLRWPPLAMRGEGPVVVLSDSGPAAADRVLAWATSQLAALRTILPGASRPRALVILACAAPATFTLWNDRLGGARWQEADGVYRPGDGLVTFLDDEDFDVGRRLLRHELVHHVVSERGWHLPPLLEEGLAELLAHGAHLGPAPSAPLAGGRFEAALELARSGVLDPPAGLLFQDEVAAAAAGEREYGQAWSAAHLLASLKTGSGGRSALAEILRHWAAGDRAAARRIASESVSAGALKAHLGSLAAAVGRQ